MSDELIHHMRGFAEECLRRIELNPEVSGNELHTKQTYVDIMKLCDRVPAAPQSDPLTKEAEASVRLDGDTHCVDDTPPSDQPEQGRPLDELNELIAIADRDGTLDIRPGLKRIAAKLAAPASQPSAPAQKPHLDGITPEFQPSPASVDAREWAERIMVRWLEGNITLESLAALLESFRAATLEQAAQLVSDTPRTPALTGAMDSLTDKIRNLGSDHNWLARQLDEVRANTLAHMLELLNGHRLLSGKPGDECSCGKWNANYPDRDRDVWQAWLQHIRALSPDPNWLARQIAEARIEGHKECCRLPNCRTLAALEAASAKLGDKEEGK